MTRSIQTIQPGARHARRALRGGLLAITLATVLAGHARADGYNQGPPRRGPQDNNGHGRGRGPPPGYQGPRYQGPRYQGYDRNPNVYYSAPPGVIYEPPNASLNFIFPLFR